MNYVIATVSAADAWRLGGRDGWSMSQLAGALDVRDHRFLACAPFTVGVEEEYMLLDPESFGLREASRRRRGVRRAAVARRCCQDEGDRGAR